MTWAAQKRRCEAWGSTWSSRPRRRPQTGWASLTPTERAIADLVAEGLSNPQIGDRLYISRRTVQTHLAHVFIKLDITTRAQLAADVTQRRAGLSPRVAQSRISASWRMSVRDVRRRDPPS